MDIYQIRRENLVDLVGTEQQNRFAERLEKNEGQISQLISGRKQIGARLARELEAKLEKPHGWMDTRHQPLTALMQDQNPSSDRHIFVPRLSVKGSMGMGISAGHIEVVSKIEVDVDALRRYVSFTSPINLRFMIGFGDSMKGTFNDGDLLLIDQGITDVRIDAIYVFQINVTPEPDVYIKRLQRRPDGALLMLSDNEKYKPHVLSDAEREHCDIQGRVLMAWNKQIL